MPDSEPKMGLSAEDERMFTAALTAPTPRIYINGFVIAQSLNDVALVVQTNGVPSAVVNMSFTTAKSLSQQLDRLVKNFEKTMSHDILTMDDIKARMGGTTQ